MRPASLPPLLLTLVCACQREGVAFTTSTSTSTSGPATTNDTELSSSSVTTTGADPSTSSSATSTTDPSTSAPATSASTFDVGSDKDLGDGTPVGCKGKIDFLFVISRAGVMYEIQSNLIEAFPKFIETIESKFDDFDYHIMVVAADDDWGHTYCTDDCPALDCKIAEPCCPFTMKDQEFCCPAPDYPCEYLDLVTKCDNTIGAGSVFPAGNSASNKPCPIDGGRRYMIKGQKDLSETFSCAAQIGVEGANRMGDALTAAMTYTINNPGGCNEGFLRKDALLMVTLVNPGGDDYSQGGPEYWYTAVVAAKWGDPSSVVMLNIGNILCPATDFTCELTKKFPYHALGDGAAKDYGPDFEKATTLVQEACSAFVPQ
ncbi:MAG: hypothetical protein R3B09_15425 [Nannocystaceae bacterium]